MQEIFDPEEWNRLRNTVTKEEENIGSWEKLEDE
jgi:hypothetical protein